MIKTLKNIAEGLVIILVGVFFLVLSLGIKQNPVKLEHQALNIFVQAKFVPMMSAVFIILLGIIYSFQLYREKAATKASMPPKMLGRELILTAMTVAYLVIASKVGFLIPTIIYFAGMLFYLNWGKKKWSTLLILTGVYTVATIYVTPWILQLNLF